MNGMDLLKRIKETNTNQEVVVITGHGTIKTAVEATKLGAFDFLTKPVAWRRLSWYVDDGVM